MDNGAASYRRYLDGEQEAFGEIVDLYRESLIFFIHRHVNNLDTAEDLAEDVFVELIVHPGRFEGKVRSRPLYSQSHETRRLTGCESTRG